MIPLVCLLSGESWEVPPDRLCVVVVGGSAPAFLTAPASGEGAERQACDRLDSRAKAAHLMTVRAWEQDWPQRAAYVLDLEHEGQGVEPGRFVWWRSVLTWAKEADTEPELPIASEVRRQPGREL